MMRVSFVIKVAGVNYNYGSRHVASLGIPSDVIATSNRFVIALTPPLLQKHVPQYNGVVVHLIMSTVD